MSTRALDIESTRCIVLASDGLWNMVRPQEAVDFIDLMDENKVALFC